MGEYRSGKGGKGKGDFGKGYGKGKGDFGKGYGKGFEQKGFGKGGGNTSWLNCLPDGGSGEGNGWGSIFMLERNPGPAVPVTGKSGGVGKGCLNQVVPVTRNSGDLGLGCEVVPASGKSGNFHEVKNGAKPINCTSTNEGGVQHKT